ncbi:MULTISPECIES: c-type cytochrome biogenesis protein CcmI [unclassified Limnohabitans]|uniref:c-type cytochrome biogenesis protein CcmI n=1 Tax=unclassified Limnohabitans TaxID=2626134 RepID=UPI0011B00DFA|nr:MULTISPECIES: c-type cytochrome biogenesis protein CcmI [unclassified Limnohabitans]BDU56429.1 c-type cytochrome biogenesis protein CcmI [Limnohabitans sp. TEGF004]
MNPALAFIYVAVAMMALVLIVLSVALWRGSQQGARLAASQADAINHPAQANAAVYRDQMAELDREFVMGNLSYEELKAARDELSQRLLADVGVDGLTDKATPHVSNLPSASGAALWRKPWLSIALLVFVVPVSSLLMYSVLGEPAALDPMALKQGVDSSAEVTPEKLTEMATALTRRLQDEPNSMEGWVMLGRVQRARGHFEESAEAYAKALALSRDDNLSIERAEVLAQKNGGSFAGEPWSIIQRVLTADPHHLNALFLAGSASYAEMNFNTALRYWERAREVVSADSPDAPELDRAIAEARSKMGLPAIPPRAVSAVETQASKVAMATSSISGRVTLVKELQGLVAPTDTVFVYATPVAGSRMPVAIVRTTADKLPFDFVLDDSTAMNPSAKLSGMDEVTVRVRISKSGQAVAQAGDYGVSLTPVKPGSKGLNLMVRDTLQTTP